MPDPAPRRLTQRTGEGAERESVDLTTRLVYMRDRRGFGNIVRQILAFAFHIDFPLSVKVGPGLKLLHRGCGAVVHPAVRIGANVTLMPQVTIGMADEAVPVPRDAWPIIEIEDDVSIGVGARILAPHTGLVVAQGTRIGANAVLLHSTGPNEVWAGVPARRLH